MSTVSPCTVATTAAPRRQGAHSHQELMSSHGDEATVEISPGRTVTLRVGMRFPDRATATQHVQSFALRQGKRAVLHRKLSGGTANVYVCSSKTPCAFEVRILRSKSVASSDFFVSPFNVNHDGCAGKAKVTAKQVCAMDAALAVAQANPTASAKAIQHHVQLLEGVQIPARMAYRVRDAIVEASSGSYESGCQRLRSLFENFQAKNPSCSYAFETDGDQHFKRAFFSHPMVSEMQPMLQRVLGMDGAFMKTPMHGNTVVILVGRNSNNENVVLTVALCPFEDEDNCLWFLRNCKHADIVLMGIPFCMDRGKGVIAAGTTMGLQLRFCTRHIIGNMKSMFKGQFGSGLESCAWAIQTAESEDEFASRLDALAVANTDIAQYVRDIPAGQWLYTLPLRK